MFANSRPRHRATSQSRPGVHGLLVSSAAVCAGTLAAVVLSGGTYALWSDTEVATVDAVSTGSLMLTATENFDDALWQNMLVGESVRQSFDVTNTGTVAANLSGSAVAASASHEVRLSRGTCAGSISSTQATVAPTALLSLAPGATATICVQVTLAAAATAGSQSPFTVTITADQVQ